MTWVYVNQSTMLLSAQYLTKKTHNHSHLSKTVYCRAPLTADIKLPTLTFSAWCCYLWGKSLVDNTVNNIKMTSVHQHWLPVQINKCPNWISAHGCCPRLLTCDRWNHDYHTVKANIKTFIKSTVWYMKKKSPRLWKRNVTVLWLVKRFQELISLWLFYHQHKSSEHLLKIPVSWGLKSIKPTNIQFCCSVQSNLPADCKPWGTEHFPIYYTIFTDLLGA